jgi:hypothetical protein
LSFRHTEQPVVNCGDFSGHSLRPEVLPDAGPACSAHRFTEIRMKHEMPQSGRERRGIAWRDDVARATVLDELR